MLKLQDILGNLLSGPVGQLLDALASMVEIAMKIVAPIGAIAYPIAVAANWIAKIADTGFGKFILGVIGVGMAFNKLSSYLRASAAAKAQETIATNTNTGSQELNTGANNKSIVGKISKRIQTLLGIGATNAETVSNNISTGSQELNTTATNTNILAKARKRILAFLGIGATNAETVSNNISTGSQELNTAANNKGILALIGKRIATVLGTAVTIAAAVAQGAWNIVLGIGNALMETSIGLWITQRVHKLLNIGTNQVLAATQAEVGATGTAAAGGLTAFLTAA